MKGDPDGSTDDDKEPPEWATGTCLDLYIPIYLACMERGVTPDVAGRMDISTIAVLLGARDGSVDAAPVDDPPLYAADGSRAPATAPPGMRRPKWWKGNEAAFKSATEGARELGTDPWGGERMD